jgi:hypothetical protein
VYAVVAIHQVPAALVLILVARPETVATTASKTSLERLPPKIAPGSPGNGADSTRAALTDS